jgi:hypothetical protein
MRIPRAAFFLCVAALISSGCSSFFYAQKGYYESKKIPGWSYHFIDAVNYFDPVESKFSSMGITFSTSERGELYLHGKFDVPKDGTWEIADTSASVRPAGRERLVQDITFTVFTPYETLDGDYRFSNVIGPITTPISGFTLERPKAVRWRKLPRYVEMIVALKLEQSERVVVSLPEIRVNGKPLSNFEAEFIWNDGTKYVYKGIQ